jgi:flagellar basal-body rod protein FlgG
MMRALWSAASGMIAQQTNVDTIANNLSNVNTTGYKNEKAEFKSLLYQTLQTETTTANGAQKPVGAQVGLGTRVVAITSSFEQGAFLANDSNTSFAIDGSGFFAIRDPEGNISYTRNGDFKLSVTNNGFMLANAQGNPVLDTEGNPILLPPNVGAPNLVVNEDGSFGYTVGNENQYVPLNQTLGLYQFNNPAGLEKLSGTLYGPTAASGQARNEVGDAALTPSTIRQKYLEGSNVQVADEMVNLIVAQRAYEMNSKAIQATDEMLGQANQLRR